MADRSQLIQARIQSAQSMSQFRRKVHRVRRLVAGDISALEDMSWVADASENEMRPQYRPNSDPSDLYDLLVQDFDSGRTNKIFQGVRTLVLQTANAAPEIEFEMLNPKLATVNSKYCKQRMGECGARLEMRSALTDYLISGLGVVKVCLQDGYPVIMNIDLLDMGWDLTSRLWHDVRWAHCTIRQPLHYWLDLFKDSKYNTTMLLDMDQDESDVPVAMVYYYDTEGKKGNHSIYLSTGEGVSEKPIYQDDNPYRMRRGQDFVPLMPFEFCHHLALPSVKMPPSVAEGMIAAQIGVWEADKAIRDAIQRGKPFYEATEGAYDPKEFAMWLNGETGGVLTRKEGKPPMEHKGGLPMDPLIQAFRAMNDREITAQGGANPYASGAPLDGVNYAAEVNAIQGQSGLVAGSIAKDQADFWQRVTRKFLAVGAQYDDMPITIQYDQDIPLEFNKLEPISRLLMPDADIVVREDSMQFMPPEKMAALAQNVLTVVSGPAIAQTFPNAVREALEKYLRATGVRNPTAWMEQPQAQAMPGMPPGMSGGMDAGAQAAASTAA